MIVIEDDTIKIEPTNQEYEFIVNVISQLLVSPAPIVAIVQNLLSKIPLKK